MQEGRFLRYSLIFIFTLLFFVLFFWNRIFKSNEINPVLTYVSPILNQAQPHDFEVSAWYPDWDEKDSVESLRVAKIHQVSPFWYRLNSFGELDTIPTKYKKEIIAIAQMRGIKVVPSIVNDFDGKRVSTLLANKSLWEEFSNTLIETAISEGYGGYDLDLEELAVKDRQKYSDFVQYLADELDKNNLMLAVTVHAQTGENERDAVKAQDLVSLAKSADEIRIMVYDFHYAESASGPVTPLGSLANVLTYTKNNLPVDKVVIGLPTYGYDWSEKVGVPLQYDDILTVLKSHNAQFGLNEEEQALYAEYRGNDGKHVVWFENSETLEAKVQMVKDAGFYKIALWRLGGEDKKSWEIFD